MADAQAFGGVLARIREAQGFPTPHSFYKSRKGRANLGMSFRNYLNIEQGKGLPKAERVETFLAALGLDEHGAPARELVEAYFSSLGLGRLSRFLREKEDPLAGEGDAEILELAARQAVQAKRVHLSLEQWGLLAGDYDAALCDDLLQNTLGGLELPELARLAGLTPATAKRAAAALIAVGLAKAAGKRVRSTVDDKIVQAAPVIPAMVGVKAGLFRNQARLAQESALVQNSVDKTRLTRRNLKLLQRQADRLSTFIDLCADSQNTGDSAVYMIRTQIFQLFPRKPVA